MVTLEKWFKKNIERPLLISAVVVLIVELTFVFYSYTENNKQQQIIIDALKTTVVQGLIYNDRRSIELAFSVALKNIKAVSVGLCHEERELVYVGELKFRCSHSGSNDFSLYRDIELPLEGMPLYQIHLKMPLLMDFDNLIFVIIISVLLVFGIIFSITHIRKTIKKDILDPLMEPLGLKRCEVQVKIKEINEVREREEKIKHLESANKISEEKAKLAASVAHDIRSPLAVLNMMLMNEETNSMAEESRIIVRNQIARIQDIANDLLARNKVRTTKEDDAIKIKDDNNKIDDNQGTLIQKGGPEIVLLATAIEEIVTEKRLYFRSKLAFHLTSDIYGPDSYGLFTEINPSELKRTLSNLITNAVEALPNYKGHVCVTLKSEDAKNVRIMIEDNGKGIPSDIIAQLGQEGFSFGKGKSRESGSGIGLFQAKKCVENCGGQLNIISELGKGTKIIITLPKAPSPSWFVPKINLESGQTVLILDDHEGIHHTWETRFKELGFHQSGAIVHISNTHDFKEWFAHKRTSVDRILCLCDYELSRVNENDNENESDSNSNNETGLDLIEEYKLNSEEAILVTSHYENSEIRSRCERLGIKLIPKMLAGFVPIEVENKIKIKENNIVINNNDDNNNKHKNLMVLITKDEKIARDIEPFLLHCNKRFKQKAHFNRITEYQQLPDLLMSDLFGKVACFLDFIEFMNNKKNIKDDAIIKHCILLEPEILPFEIENDDDLTSIVFNQRDRAILRIIKEHFNESAEVS